MPLVGSMCGYLLRWLELGIQYTLDLSLTLAAMNEIYEPSL